LKTEGIIQKINVLCDELDIDNKIYELTQLVNDAHVKVMLGKSKQLLFNFFDEMLKFNPDADLERFYDVYAHIPAVLKLNNLPLHLDCVKVVDANNSMEIFDNLFIMKYYNIR
jgi:hypothetical protein